MWKKKMEKGALLKITETISRKYLKKRKSVIWLSYLKAYHKKSQKKGITMSTKSSVKWFTLQRNNKRTTTTTEKIDCRTFQETTILHGERKFST